MVALCVLPLGGVRVGAGTAPLERSQSNRPIEEEDESERTDAEQRDADLRTERRIESRHGTPGRLIVSARIAHTRSSRHIPSADPYRNGLGTHYRC